MLWPFRFLSLADKYAMYPFIFKSLHAIISKTHDSQKSQILLPHIKED